MEVEKDIIFKHELVHKHELLTKEGADAVLKRYGVAAEQLPKIRVTDAVANALGAKKGNIVKITRKSPTAGEAPYFRLVI